MEPKTKRILELARSQVVRPRDLVELGVPRSVLTELVADGSLLRAGRGLYTAADYPNSENHSLVLAAKRYPEAVVCLLSAAHFHQITLELPAEVWLAFPRQARIPHPADIQLMAVRLSEDGKSGCSAGRLAREQAMLGLDPACRLGYGSATLIKDNELNIISI